MELKRSQLTVRIYPILIYYASKFDINSSNLLKVDKLFNSDEVHLLYKYELS